MKKEKKHYYHYNCDWHNSCIQFIHHPREQCMSRGKRVESNSPSKPNRCIVCVGSWRFCCTYSFTCHNYNRLRITRENVGRVKQTPAHIWRKWKLYRIMDDIQEERKGWKGYCIFFLSFRIHCNSSQPAGGFIIKAGGIALQTTLLHWPPTMSSSPTLHT